VVAGASRARASERYTELSVVRDRYLLRFRNCASFTIPHIMPPEGHQDGDELMSPAQSDGAQCVNSLAAKYFLGILPPNIPMFRLEYANFSQRIQAGAQGGQLKAAAAQIDEELKNNIAKAPRECLLLTELFMHRPVIGEAMKHLIIGGNVLMWFMASGTIRAVPLSKYCVLRDSLGFVREVVIKETINSANLPPKLQAIRESKMTMQELIDEASKVKTADPQEPHVYYTYACWDDKRKRYYMHQEYLDEEVEGTDAIYTTDNFPLNPLCFSRADCEDYGRGLVEEYFGILMALEAIARSVTALVVSMADCKTAVHPAAGIRARDLEAMPENAYVDADPAHIGRIVANVGHDLAGIQGFQELLQRKLGMAFLVQSSVVRDSERTTQFEVMQMIRMLDETRGGDYSVLSGNFQAPYVRYQLRLLKKSTDGKIDLVGTKTVRPRIVTGLAALGQNAEAAQVIEYFNALGKIFGPEAVAAETNIGIVGTRLGTNFNLDTDGFFKTDEQKQAEAQARAQDEQNKAATPGIVAAAGGLLKGAQEQGAAA